MKLLVLSDLHFEFHMDGGRSFLQSFDPRGIDGVIIAGDLCSSTRLTTSLRWICQYFAEQKVFYVPGNHEYYGSSFKNVADELANVGIKNLVLLSRKAYVLPNGHRIVGATMWFRQTPTTDLQASAVNDFVKIKDFRQHVYVENERDVAYLKQVCEPGDIVVTHHSPSYMSVPEQFKTSSINCFFVCDAQDIIEEQKPSLWIHGHTHSSMDYRLYGTRVLCNPFGYALRDENLGFNDHLVVEV